MPAFDRQFTPPAPVANVIVTHPVSSANSGVIRGKLDTGADLTVIPGDQSQRHWPVRVKAAQKYGLEKAFECNVCVPQ